MKSIGMTLAILCSLFVFGMVNSSHAIQIVDFPSDTEASSYNGYTYHMAYVKTDNPIYFVSWFIDGTHVHGETIGSTTSDTSYFPYDKIPGSVKGTKYQIGVKVWEWDAEAEVFRSTTDSYKVRMFQPIYLNRVGTKTGAYGSVEISSFYYDGSSVVMSSSSQASNPTNNPKAIDPDDNPLKVATWFRTNQFESLNGEQIHPEQRDTKPTETVEVGNSSEYYSPNGSIVDRWVGDLVEGGNTYYFLAHTHLHVYTTKGNHKEDHWEMDTGVLEFSAADK